MSESDGALRIVKTVDDAIHCFNQDKMAVCIHFEGAEPIAPNLSNLDDYYASGLRSVGISRPNAFAYGVPIEFPGHANHGPGLSSAPLVATHSNAHSLCASSRYLTGKQLDAIGSSNGLVGINFAVYFLHKDGQPNADTPLEIIVNILSISRIVLE